MDIFFKLEMIANNMSIILNITNKELEHNIYSTKAINNINLLISNLVELNSNIKAILSQYPNDNITDSLNGLASCFESIISGYELNEDNSIKDIFINRLVPRFEKFYNDLDSYIFKITGVKNAVVTGVNELSINIEKLVDLKKCRIVAFISNDNEMQGKYIKNIPIFTRSELSFVKLRLFNNIRLL
ncbi:hypothetical protein [Clostridium sp. DMHC 10]|uniref:hypothetical protein n=1 Tax=Clostridium sp. DMHC 10 TaxID=747377 RepID=UPI00069D9931|nr:hypothetical protein [Clostridium sp. DMHC 10]